MKKITAPALICGSFSDQCLHTGGSFRTFAELSSPHKWLYTHRAGKWATYYSPEALAFQQKFFDHFLKGAENGMPDVPPVRLEVRDTGQHIHAVRKEQSFPPAATRWTPLYLNAGTGQLLEELPATVQTTGFDLEKGAAVFEWTVPRDLELSGPMVLRLTLEVKGASDLNLFAGIRKIRAGRQVVFEGSYGFGYDIVTRGWQKASLGKPGAASSSPGKVDHAFAVTQPRKPGEKVSLEISLLPSATFFKKGDILQLDLQGHWFFPSNPVIYGPAKYEKSLPGQCLIYSGGEYVSQLIIPLQSN